MLGSQQLHRVDPFDVQVHVTAPPSAKGTEAAARRPWATGAHPRTETLDLD